MRLQLTMPSKTYLLGEYLSLTGGPALLLNTSSRFNLIATKNSANEQFSYRNIDENSPAGKYIKKHYDFFKNFTLDFYDPYNGLGGFGASSAQFGLMVALKNYYEKTTPNFTELIKEYRELAWGGKGYSPSGADVIAQLCGGITYYHKNENIIKKLVWPFTNLVFALIHTKNKVFTERHIEELQDMNIVGLEEITLAGLASLEQVDSVGFCKAINDYANIMQKKNMVDPITVKLLEKIGSNHNILAAKGCGALGADVILVLFPKDYIEEFTAWAMRNCLDVIQIGFAAKDGVAIESENIEDKSRVILVDKNDYQIGIEEKLKAHKNSLMHRAYSVFIFRKNNNEMELLLQQRAKHKYHSGGLWTNTCCSHPAPGEDTLFSAKRRLQLEMGISKELYEIGAFHYVADLHNGMVENEYDHVFVGVYNNERINPDRTEIEDYQWMPLKKLQQDLQNNPEKFTPWLDQALGLILENKILENLLNDRQKISC